VFQCLIDKIFCKFFAINRVNKLRDTSNHAIVYETKRDDVS